MAMNNTDNSAGKPSPLAPLRAWWAGLGARERSLLGWGGSALVLFLTWMLAVQPALNTLRTAPVQLDALDLQWQAMQKQAGEARELRGITPMTAEQSLVALKATTDRLGDKAKLSVQGDRAVVTFTGVNTGQLRDWMAEARSGARARPVEATLNRAGQGYSGTLVVAVGGSL